MTNNALSRAEESAWDVVYELLEMAHDRLGRVPMNSCPRARTVQAAISEALHLVPAEEE